MDILMSDGQPKRPPRGFAALHRDVWRVVRKAPFVFLALPAIVWFPIDGAIEGIVANMELDYWGELRFYFKLERFAQWIVGTLVIAVQLYALQVLATQHSIRVFDALRGGFDSWSRMLGVFFSAAWRTSLATLLLIVPGIYLMVRYSLAMPVAAFEEKRGSDALEASGRYVKGSGWKIFFIALAALALYAPAMMAPFLFLPGAAGPLLQALASVPGNVLAPLMFVGLALMYADRKEDWPAAEPVGQSDAGIPVAIGVSPSGARGVLLAGSLSYFVAVMAFAFALILPDRLVAAADVAFDAGQYEDALAKYERAAYWFPDDAYIEYSLGWSLFMVDDPDNAEIRMSKAVELEPGNPYYVLDHASVLFELNRFEEAKAAVERASELEHPEREKVQRLRTLISLNSALSPSADDANP